MNAVRKELTKEVTCRKCKQDIVLIRTSKNVRSAKYKCPTCGIEIKVVY